MTTPDPLTHVRQVAMLAIRKAYRSGYIDAEEAVRNGDPRMPEDCGPPENYWYRAFAELEAEPKEVTP